MKKVLRYAQFAVIAMIVTAAFYCFDAYTGNVPITFSQVCYKITATMTVFAAIVCLREIRYLKIKKTENEDFADAGYYIAGIISALLWIFLFPLRDSMPLDQSRYGLFVVFGFIFTAGVCHPRYSLVGAMVFVALPFFGGYTSLTDFFTGLSWLLLCGLAAIAFRAVFMTDWRKLLKQKNREAPAA